MSAGNRRSQRGTSRHLCAACRARRARFQYRGEVKADRQHVLCFQCYRAARERLRAWQIHEGVAAERPGASWLRMARLSSPPTALTERQLQHRAAMLAHLKREAAGLR